MAAFVNRVREPGSLLRGAGDFRSAAPDTENLYRGNYTLGLMSQLKGALHAALELSAANSTFHDDNNYVVNPDEISGFLYRDPSRAKDTGFENNKGFVASVGLNVPGYLSQVDLLSGLGHLMTVRSDTFTIRVQGQCKGLDREILSTAYGEAVVRRVIDYVDSANAADAGLDELSTENRRFGRRFEIVGFRWLDPDEI